MAEKELELKLPKIHKDDLDESYRDDKKIQHDLFCQTTHTDEGERNM